MESCPNNSGALATQPDRDRRETISRLLRTFGLGCLVGVAATFAAFFLMHPDDLRQPVDRAVLAVVVIGGYSLAAGLAVGLGSVILRLLWGWWGYWLPITLGSASAGFAGGVAAVWWELSQSGFPSSGPHGGGKVAAAAVAAGLFAGGVTGAFTGLTTVVVFAALHHRRSKN